MGLIRKIIVVGGALLALPTPPQTQQNGNIVQASMPSSSWAYISAAADTVSDMKDFCTRKPQVCGTAKYLVGTLEGKAKYSAKLVYEWANGAPVEAAKADPIQTGSVQSKAANLGLHNSTLEIEDLLPEWRGTLNPEKG